MVTRRKSPTTFRRSGGAAESSSVDGRYYGGGAIGYNEQSDPEYDTNEDDDNVDGDDDDDDNAKSPARMRARRQCRNHMRRSAALKQCGVITWAFFGRTSAATMGSITGRSLASTSTNTPSAPCPPAAREGRREEIVRYVTVMTATGILTLCFMVASLRASYNGSVSQMTSKPMVVGYIPGDDSNLRDHEPAPYSYRKIPRESLTYFSAATRRKDSGMTNGVFSPTDSEDNGQKQGSHNSKRHRLDPWKEGDCIAMHPWQESSFPTCNNLHELGNIADPAIFSSGDVRFLDYGYFRDVWIVHDEAEGTINRVVLKTLRYKHDFDLRNYDRHRRDAVAMERLTSSSHVLDVFSYCGNSGVFELSKSGDIYDVTRAWIRKKGRVSSTYKLTAAVQVSLAVADLHGHETEGRASIAHTDITPLQFVFVDGFFKLNDFNRCRFIRVNRITNESCPYRVGNNPGPLRSPEEYSYNLQTEKVDVYAMGNVFYFLLTNTLPFDGLEDEEVQQRVMDGRRPKLPESVRNSADWADVAILKAMKMCFVHDADERPTARQVSKFLKDELIRMERGEHGDG